MRFVFWLLLILNAGVFIYFNLDMLAPPPLSTTKPEIHPEKMKLLSQNEVDAMPARVLPIPEPLPPPVSDEPVACYEWGSVASTKLEDALSILNTLSIKHRVIQQNPEDSIRYWVYKPPLASDEAAQLKAQELKALGIEDFFIVQEPKLRNAISFGIFKDEQLATKLMDDLRHRGVRELVKSVRNQGDAGSMLMLEGVTSSILEQLKKNQPDFPTTEINPSDCPAT